MIYLLLWNQKNQYWKRTFADHVSVVWKYSTNGSNRFRLPTVLRFWGTKPFRFWFRLSRGLVTGKRADGGGTAATPTLNRSLSVFHASVPIVTKLLAHHRRHSDQKSGLTDSWNVFLYRCFDNPTFSTVDVAVRFFSPFYSNLKKKKNVVDSQNPFGVPP